MLSKYKLSQNKTNYSNYRYRYHYRMISSDSLLTSGLVLG
jgi:hypothetical protein